MLEFPALMAKPGQKDNWEPPMKNHLEPNTAFTIMELLVVLAVITVLGATLLPALALSKSKAERINCINNLKQIGFAYRAWEAANNGHYPQALPARQGGAQDYCTHGDNNNSVGSIPSIVYNPGMVYMVMSNYLVTPKLLFCPADNFHTGAATNFSYGDLLGVVTPANQGYAPALSALTKVSYFVGADANETDTQSILAGDCNIGNTGTSGNAPSTTRFGTVVSGTLSAPEIISSAFSGNGSTWAWTASDLHQKAGNLLIADGSVQATSITGLHTFMQNATNTVTGPCWNFLP